MTAWPRTAYTQAVDRWQLQLTLYCKHAALFVQLSLQYRVAQDRLYEAFYSMEHPQAQVTSYGARRRLV